MARLNGMSWLEHLKYQAQILDEQVKNGTADQFILYDTDDELRGVV